MSSSRAALGHLFTLYVWLYFPNSGIAWSRPIPTDTIKEDRSSGLANVADSRSMECGKFPLLHNKRRAVFVSHGIL